SVVADRQAGAARTRQVEHRELVSRRPCLVRPPGKYLAIARDEIAGRVEHHLGVVDVAAVAELGYRPGNQPNPKGRGRLAQRPHPRAVEWFGGRPQPFVGVNSVITVAAQMDL